MNSSAKVTVLTLFAAGALGVAVFSACTVTSSTNNDFDGGTSSSGGSSGSSGTSGGPVDSGDPVDSGGGGTCTTKQNPDSKFDPPACQTCLEAKCCTEMTRCFDIVGSGGAFDCNDYSDCVLECESGDGGVEDCEADCRNATGGDGGVGGGGNGVVEAYDGILGCAAKTGNCAEACGL